MVRCLTKPAAVVNAYSSARVRGDWRSARVSAPTATVSRSIRCHLRSEYLVTDCSSHRSLLRPCPRCLASAQLLRLPLPVSRPITNYSPSMFGRTVCSGQRRDGACVSGNSISVRAASVPAAVSQRYSANYHPWRSGKQSAGTGVRASVCSCRRSARPALDCERSRSVPSAVFCLGRW